MPHGDVIASETWNYVWEIRCCLWVERVASASDPIDGVGHKEWTCGPNTPSKHKRKKHKNKHRSQEKELPPSPAPSNSDVSLSSRIPPKKFSTAVMRVMQYHTNQTEQLKNFFFTPGCSIFIIIHSFPIISFELLHSILRFAYLLHTLRPFSSLRNPFALTI